MLEQRKKLVLELLEELTEGFRKEVDELEIKNQRLKEWDDQVKKMAWQLTMKVDPTFNLELNRGHTVDALLCLGHAIDKLTKKQVQ